MNINQHNYEEFFLLYADGELSAADKLVVDQFVQGNPGLADELEMFVQMRLPHEPLVFADKDLLYRNGSTGISLDNYEENFLLYVDEELDKDAKAQVETFVLQHPTLQKDFTLLKQARLEPEPVYFPDKELLYRKEKKKRPVFYIGWQRVAVAAAFIGLVVLVWTVTPGNKKTQQQTVAQQTPAGKVPDPAPSLAVAEQENGLNKPVEKAIVNNIAAITTRKILPVVINRNNVQPKNVLVENANRPDLPATNQDVAPTGVSLPKAIAIVEKNDVARVTRPTQELATDKISLSGSEMVKPTNANENVIASLAKPAVYKELDTEDEKKSLYLGSLEINKDKLRGFFRKAGSIFRSKARQQEEERSETGPADARSLK